MQITKLIDREKLYEIIEYCDEYDNQFFEKEVDSEYIIDDEKKCKEAGNVVSDITGIWAKNDVDLDDLNKRLGLK